MSFINIPTEQTTAVTDAILAVIAIAGAVYLYRISQKSRWKTTLWIWLFVLLAISAILGTIIHGLEMPKVFKTLLWHPLYLSLGLLVGMFMVAVIHDIWGKAAARQALPIMAVVSVGFFGTMLGL